MKNMKKVMALALAAAMTVSLFAGCGAKSGEGKTVRYGMGYDASTLDTGRTTDDASITPSALLIEPLLRRKGEDVIPGVAETWEVSEDAKEWTFHLRKSTFSDGTEITANDFAYTLKRLANPENALDNMAAIADLAGFDELQAGTATVDELGIEVVDDYTLKLTYMFPQYEKSFTGYAYAPLSQAAVEAAGENYGAEADKVLGNGPFMVESWTHDSEIVMVKNPKYWNAEAVKLDKIIQVAGATGDTAIDMMSTGTLEAASFTNAMYRDSALEIDGMTSMVDYVGTQSMHLNNLGKTEETGKWLGNVNFRKAISYAIDRTALQQAVYTTDTVASKVIPDSEMGVEKPLNEEYDYPGLNVTAEPEEAQKYLALAMEELGASDVSEIPTFTMLAFDSESNVKCLNAIADMLDKNLGVKCELDMEPITEMIGKAMSRDFDFWKGGNAFTIDYVEAFQLYDSVYGEGSAVNYVDDETYHELYLAAIESAKWEDRKAAEAKLAEYWTENMMDILLTWSTGYYVYNENITDVYTGRMFCDFTYADMK